MRATPPTLRTYAVIALIAGLLGLHASAANARTEHLRWMHPAPADVSHFEVHTGLASGVYDSIIPDVDPAPDSDYIFHFDLDVPDAQSIYVVIKAVGTNGKVSLASNEGFRPSALPPPPPPSVDPLVIPARINGGGPELVDGNGNLWVNDTAFTSNGAVYIGTHTTSGTDIPEVYKSQRASVVDLVYALPVDNGSYLVRLHFVESYVKMFVVGGRVFDVGIEGNKVVDDLDIFATVGSYAAHVEEIHVDVDDGMMNIVFSTEVQGARIDGIEILAPGPDMPPPERPAPPVLLMISP